MTTTTARGGPPSHRVAQETRRRAQGIRPRAQYLAAIADRPKPWIALKQYGPAHTDGDISVTFTDADILHAGDTFWNGVYPFIDYSTGGHIDGMIRAADANY